MKRILQGLILSLLSLGLTHQVSAQCDITATGYPIEICRGEPVMLTASGACGYLMLNDFNNGTIGLGWFSNASPMFNNPCPPTNPPASGIVCWIGSATNFPRHLTTIAYNLSIGAGYTIEWDQKYGANQNPTNCESPDLPGEGVHLQYSIVGPTGPWHDINYWTPVPGNAATGPYYTWNHYVENVPAIAYTPNTHFRWYQDVTSGNTWDHWGIDNVEIKAASGLNSNVLWSTGDTTFSTLVYPDSTGMYTVVIYDTLYSALDSVFIIVHQIPNANFTLNTPICSESDSVVLQYTGNAPYDAEYFWQVSGGLDVNSNGPGPHTLSNLAAGQYMVTLNVNNRGCNSDMDTMWFTVNQRPLVSFAADYLFGCDPVTVNFSNNTYPVAATFDWEFGDGTTANGPSPTHTFWYSQTDSAYSVKLIATTADGCSNEYTIEDFIAVYPMPIADYDAVPDSTPFREPEIVFNDMSSPTAISWFWDFGDGETSTDKDPTHTYLAPGEYKVFLEVKTKYGCTDTVSYIVKVIEEMIDSLIFPNVFTPNGDGVNDKFVIDKLEDKHYLNRELIVFNRWGKKVYEASGYLNQWDGAGVPDGTYYFIFRYTYAFHSEFKPKEVSGVVTILR
ncbi:MAG TPA: PKD domain-containing protein [Bacteroidales bacterium]|nr:PKD domain-containing protein [Bacteroidales bacterium]